MSAIKNVAPWAFLDLQRKRGKLADYLHNPETVKNGVEAGQLKITEKFAEECILESMPSDTPDEDTKRATQLLVYLVETGHIDEGYFFYLARPDDKGLSDGDQAWLLNSRNGESSYDQVLDVPEMVYSYLHDYELLRPSAMNLSLVEWMLDNVDPDEAAFQNLVSCTLDKAHDFAEFLVERSPRFPYIATKSRVDYLAVSGDVNEKYFALSVICGVQTDQELMEINVENEGRLARIVSETAGLYAAAEIEQYSRYCENVVSDVVRAMGILEVKAAVLDPAASEELTSSIVEVGLYEQTVVNCSVGLSNEGFHVDAGVSAIDVAASNKSSKVWGNIERAPEVFADEYLKSTDCLTCTEDTFLALVNLNMKQETRVRFTNAYSGAVNLLCEIEDSSVWDAVLKSASVPCNVRNMADYLSNYGATRSWVAFVNDANDFSIGEDPDDGLKSLIVNHVLKAVGLDDSRYEVFAQALDNYSVSSVPNGVQGSKLAILYDNKTLGMTVASLTAMRSGYDGGFCLPYIDGALEEYMDLLASCRGTDQEISAVLGLNHAKRLGLQAELVNLLRSPIALEDYHDNVTAEKLIEGSKLLDTSYENALMRYGRSRYLDEKLANLAARMPSERLMKADIDREVIAASIPHSSAQKRLEIIRGAASWNWSDLEAVLRAFSLSELDSILANGHPKRSELSSETVQVIDTLVAANRASISEEGRVYLRRMISAAK